MCDVSSSHSARFGNLNLLKIIIIKIWSRFWCLSKMKSEALISDLIEITKVSELNNFPLDAKRRYICGNRSSGISRIEFSDFSKAPASFLFHLVLTLDVLQSAVTFANVFWSQSKQINVISGNFLMLFLVVRRQLNLSCEEININNFVD